MSTALSAPQSILVPQQQPLSEDWKQELAERLDSYRAHRPRAAVQPISTESASTNSRASKIARAVASRYAAAPTHCELLAAAVEAARVEEAARAEAQAAEERRLRQAAEMAQAAAMESATNLFDGEQAPAERDVTVAPSTLTAVIPGKAVMPQFVARTREMHLHQAAAEPEPSLEDLLASAVVEPRAMLPSKLIEFPRELVSSRRSRPHLPESPRGEHAAPFQPEPTQLRIFEVEPDSETATVAKPESSTLPTLAETAPPAVSAPTVDAVVPVTVPPTVMPHSSGNSAQGSISAAAKPRPATHVPSLSMAGTDQSRMGTARSAASVSNTSPANTFRGLEWASISLDKEPASYRKPVQGKVAEYVPFMVDPASIDRRVMAFAVDFAAVTAGFLAFLTVFVASTPHLPTGLTALALAGAVYVTLWVLYQMLFFSLSGATAGMLYARIALCTFDDQNPPRAALQRRLAAWWLSLLPLGIGFLWCFVDEDNLCWHDRITRMYQREY